MREEVGKQSDCFSGDCVQSVLGGEGPLYYFNELAKNHTEPKHRMISQLDIGIVHSLTFLSHFVLGVNRSFQLFNSSLK